ncbi:MAG: molybdopterin converting factor subunit 1 [Gammaproteobacteria bacterium]|jgi:sulfur-carrier protein|nr:molybdopterin converting factor subunit 1 [Gammaproteobacteria bacterium]MBT7370561.1 molybdopterin converting factor subunit 1 [Gammaproteobacteria bacterium]
MAELVFFASIREDLGCERINVDISEGATLSELMKLIVETHGESWHQALTAENVRVAVNQELVTGNPQLGNQDEVAFFPPVTGG